MRRRTFLGLSAGAVAALGDFAFLRGLGAVRAEEARLSAGMVTLHAEIEPLVRFLEQTPRERVLEELAGKIKRGLSYREVLAALLLAGVRNIQPRPVGFKFHAVLVVNSAHLASLASPDADRWLPILWAVDQFKSSQTADVREGDWTLAPVDERAVPPSHKAKQALVDALEKWDEPAADAAIVGMVRTAGADEIFEILARYGARDFREIGHKEIYVANSFRTLEAIGWHHAEPVLRSLVYAILDRDGAKENPSKADYGADRPYRQNLAEVAKIRAGWLDGKLDSDATADLLEALRYAAPNEAGEKAIELLNRGVSPRSLFDAYFDFSGELMMRAPGILSLHATTFTNALRYSWQKCRDEETRKMLMLQNASFLPLFRGDRRAGARIDDLEPAAKPARLEEIFAGISQDKGEASRKILRYLQDEKDPGAFAQAARRLIFLKGTNSHDYKYSSAVLEDYSAMTPKWRDRFLAATSYYFKGSSDPDNQLVQRIRAALT